MITYPVFTRVSGERVSQVFAVVLVLPISSTNELSCVLILHERSGPRTVSDLFLHRDRLATTWHTLSLAFRHLPPNFATTGYASEGAHSLSSCICPPTLSSGFYSAISGALQPSNRTTSLGWSGDDILTCRALAAKAL